MSQLTHPVVTFRAHRAVVLAALLALAATAAVVLVFAIGGSSSNSSATPASPSTQSGVRYDGGPEEGSYATQPGSATRYDGGPEEGSASTSGRYADRGPESEDARGAVPATAAGASRFSARAGATVPASQPSSRRG